MKKDIELQRVKDLLSRVSMSILGIPIDLIIKRDVNDSNGRIFIQVGYNSECTNTGNVEYWKGGKHYLSEHMTDDEIIKQAWVRFEQAVKHETMEGFKVDNIVLFNPHTNFESLLKVSQDEVRRKPTN